MIFQTYGAGTLPFSIILLPQFPTEKVTTITDMAGLLTRIHPTCFLSSRFLSDMRACPQRKAFVLLTVTGAVTVLHRIPFSCRMATITVSLLFVSIISVLLMDVKNDPARAQYFTKESKNSPIFTHSPFHVHFMSCEQGNRGI
jgi:hypothetical protein